MSVLRCGLRNFDNGLVKQKFEEADGFVHMSAQGETSWHGFACAIIDGLHSRGVQLAVGSIAAIESSEFPTKAARPHNSRLAMGRLEKIFGTEMPNWRDALDLELDDFVRPEG